MHENQIGSCKFEDSRNNSNVASERGPNMRFKDWAKDDVTPQGVNRSTMPETQECRIPSSNKLYKFGAAMNNPKQQRAARTTERLN
jgi:hypothetical protein